MGLTNFIGYKHSIAHHSRECEAIRIVRLNVTFIEYSTKEKGILTQTDTNANPEQKSYTEELQVMGEQLLSKVKELLHEGNVRRIIIKQEGRTIMEFPLTIGVVGVVAAPVLVAIGAISALIAQCSIEVIRSEIPTASVTEEPPTSL
jgi:hypothetical protein